MVDTISVVPEDAEIVSLGLHSGKTLYHLIREGDARRVAVHRHTPHAFDAFVLGHQLFYHVHIRTVVFHGYIYHFKPESFGNKEVSVISRTGTQPFKPALILPGR